MRCQHKHRQMLVFCMDGSKTPVEVKLTFLSPLVGKRVCLTVGFQLLLLWCWRTCNRHPSCLLSKQDSILVRKCCWEQCIWIFKQDGNMTSRDNEIEAVATESRKYREEIEMLQSQISDLEQELANCPTVPQELLQRRQQLQKEKIDIGSKVMIFVKLWIFFASSTTIMFVQFHLEECCTHAGIFLLLTVSASQGSDDHMELSPSSTKVVLEICAIKYRLHCFLYCLVFSAEP